MWEGRQNLPLGKPLLYCSHPTQRPWCPLPAYPPAAGLIFYLCSQPATQWLVSVYAAVGLSLPGPSEPHPASHSFHPEGHAECQRARAGPESVSHLSNQHPGSAELVPRHFQHQRKAMSSCKAVSFPVADTPFLGTFKEGERESQG